MLKLKRFQKIFSHLNECERCYIKMEDIGIAVFGMCGGDDQSMDRLKKHCLHCPYYIRPLKKEDVE